MKLTIIKVSDTNPPIGEEVFVWNVDEETQELELLGTDTAIEFVIDEGSAELTAEYEEKLVKQGFVVGIGWANFEDNIHGDEYWSLTRPD